MPSLFSALSFVFFYFSVVLMFVLTASSDPGFARRQENDGHLLELLKSFDPKTICIKCKVS